jgi:hypothetical protein
MLGSRFPWHKWLLKGVWLRHASKLGGRATKLLSSHSDLSSLQFLVMLMHVQLHDNLLMMTGLAIQRFLTDVAQHFQLALTKSLTALTSIKPHC